jgi:hypothetical protein
MTGMKACKGLAHPIRWEILVPQRGFRWIGLRRIRGHIVIS